MSKLLSFFIFLFIISCSSVDNTKQDVDLNLQTDSIFKQDTFNEQTKTKIEDVGGLYSENGQLEKATSIREPVIVLELSPGLNRVLGHLSLLRAMELEKVRPHMIIGHGLSTLITVLYSDGHSPDYIEWVFFKFFKKTTRMKAYSKKWREEVEATFFPLIKSKKIQDGNITLIIPLYNKKTQKVEYLKRGNIKKAIMSNLTLSTRTDEYIHASSYNIFDKEISKNLGGDILIVSDVLGSRLNIGPTNNDLLNIWGKSITRINQNKQNVDVYVKLPLESLQMDYSKNYPEYITSSVAESSKKIKHLNNYIESWQTKASKN